MTRVTRILAMAVMLVVTVTGVAQAYFASMATGSGTATVTIGTWKTHPQPQPPGPPTVPPGPPANKPPVTPPGKKHTVLDIRCMVPRLKGKTLVQAKRTLRQHHCQVGKVMGHGKHGKGHVVKQSARAGTHHPKGYRVNIRVR